MSVHSYFKFWIFCGFGIFLLFCVVRGLGGFRNRVLLKFSPGFPRLFTGFCWNFSPGSGIRVGVRRIIPPIIFFQFFTSTWTQYVHSSGEEQTEDSGTDRQLTRQLIERHSRELYSTVLYCTVQNNYHCMSVTDTFSM